MDDDVEDLLSADTRIVMINRLNLSLTFLQTK